jgi:hypothetical protein
MKTKLRMATVFTGAAACATAFGPAAGAATTAGAGTTAAAATTAATAGKPLPSNIDEVDCTAADAHWFHLYWSAAADHGPTCLGYKGLKAVDHWFSSWCPGNNYGYFTYLSSQGGGPYTYIFSAGELLHSYPYSAYILDVYIGGWSGPWTCPS